MKPIIIIRVRGKVNPKEESTLEYLNLKKKFHATIIDDRPSYMGMVKKVNNYIAWGEIDKETMLELFRKRGRLIGDKKIDENKLKEEMKVNGLEELVEKIFNGEITLNKLPLIKPYFRLHPPRGGFKGSIKKGVKEGGVLGYHGKNINKLLRKMM